MKRSRVIRPSREPKSTRSPATTGELSMSPSAVPAVRYALRHTSLETCQQMAKAALTSGNAEQAVSAVLNLMNAEVKEAMALE